MRSLKYVKGSRATRETTYTLNASSSLSIGNADANGLTIGSSSTNPATIVLINKNFTSDSTNNYATYSNWGGGAGTVIMKNLTSGSEWKATSNATCFINNSGTETGNQGTNGGNLNHGSVYMFYMMNSSYTTAYCGLSMLYNGLYSYCDRSIKQNIKPLNTQKCLNKILNITTYSFQHIVQPDIQSIGVISNDVCEINPYCTLDMPWSFKNSLDNSGNIIYDLSNNPVLVPDIKKAINYNDLLIHSIGSIQELYKMIQTLQSQIATLTAEVAALQSK